MQIRPDRRSVLAACAGAMPGICGISPLVLAGDSFAAVKKTLRFPQDHRIHPEFAWESWQLAGFAKDGQQEFGFQVSFYRSLNAGTHAWLAHASVTDVANGRFLHDQRATGKGLEANLSVADWSLNVGTREIATTVKSNAFTFALTMTPVKPALLHGDGGLVPTGPDKNQFVYQYSLPQCPIQGTIDFRGLRLTVHSEAWLTHEWSQDFSAHHAAGWDAFSMHLFDGSFVQAFQVRSKSGARLWDGGILLTAKGQRFEFRRGSVEFSRQKTWKSRLTQANYPVEWIVRTPADFYTVRAVLADQEVDNRRTANGVYWKGLSDLLDSNGKHIGRGYLEMTGYAQSKSL